MSSELVSHITLTLEKSNLQLKVSQSYRLTSSAKILLTSSEPSDPWWFLPKPFFRYLTYQALSCMSMVLIGGYGAHIELCIS